jgi:hypothetical protein
MAYLVPFGPIPLAWPMATPGANLDYTLDVGPLLNDAADQIASVSFAISPSGSGELSCSAVAFTDSLITVQLAGGVPGRSYLTRFDVVTEGGRTFEVNVWLAIDPTLAATPLPLAPDLGFGTPVTAT